MPFALCQDRTGPGCTGIDSGRGRKAAIPAGLIARCGESFTWQTCCSSGPTVTSMIHAARKRASPLHPDALGVPDMHQVQDCRKGARLRPDCASQDVPSDARLLTLASRVPEGAGSTLILGLRMSCQASPCPACSSYSQDKPTGSRLRLNRGLPMSGCARVQPVQQAASCSGVRVSRGKLVSLSSRQIASIAPRPDSMGTRMVLEIVPPACHDHATRRSTSRHAPANGAHRAGKVHLSRKCMPHRTRRTSLEFQARCHRTRNRMRTCAFDTRNSD